VSRSVHYPSRYQGHKLYLAEQRDRKIGKRGAVRSSLKKEFVR
jgi:hypothetical protein